MGFKVGDAFVEFFAKTQRLDKDLAGAEDRINKFAAKMKKVAAAATLISSTVLAFRGLARAGGEAEREFDKLEGVLKATGQAAQISLQGLKDMSSQMQELTGIEQGIITKTQAIIATFKNIKGDAFKRATQSVLDMSAVLDQDLRSGAIQVGKALNDPLQGLTALSRVGVSFTESQKKAIKTMVEMNDVAGAQKVILKELESEFGGVAAKLAGGYTGAVMRAKTAWKALIENIGRAIIDITGITDAMTKLGDKVFEVGNKIGELVDAGQFKRWRAEISATMKLIQNDLNFPFELLVTVVGTSIGNTLTVVQRFANSLKGLFDTGDEKGLLGKLDRIKKNLKEFKFEGLDLDGLTSIPEAISNATQEFQDREDSILAGLDKQLNAINDEVRRQNTVASEEQKQAAKKKPESVGEQFVGFVDAIKKAQEKATGDTQQKMLARIEELKDQNKRSSEDSKELMKKTNVLLTQAVAKLDPRPIFSGPSNLTGSI